MSKRSAVLEAICQEQGWKLTVVESSFQILRLLRDGSDISLVIVDASLPGLGIAGRDVARTIKTTAQFRHALRRWSGGGRGGDGSSTAYVSQQRASAVVKSTTVQ